MPMLLPLPEPPAAAAALDFLRDLYSVLPRPLRDGMATLFVVHPSLRMRIALLLQRRSAA